MLIRVELGTWTLHLEVGRTQPADQPPDNTPYPMQVWAPECVGFLPPRLDPHDDEDRTR